MNRGARCEEGSGLMLYAVSRDWRRRKDLLRACVGRDWDVGTTARMGSRPGYQADNSG